MSRNSEILIACREVREANSKLRSSLDDALAKMKAWQSIFKERKA